jgi:hypothetical protein
MSAVRSESSCRWGEEGPMVVEPVETSLTLEPFDHAVLTLIGMAGVLTGAQLDRLLGGVGSKTTLRRSLMKLRGQPEDRSRDRTRGRILMEPGFRCPVCRRGGVVHVVRRPRPQVFKMAASYFHGEPGAADKALAECRAVYEIAHARELAREEARHQLVPSPPVLVDAAVIDAGEQRSLAFVLTEDGARRMTSHLASKGAPAVELRSLPADMSTDKIIRASMLGETVVELMEALGLQREPWRLPGEWRAGGRSITFARAREPGEGAQPGSRATASVTPEATLIIQGRRIWLHGFVAPSGAGAASGADTRLARAVARVYEDFTSGGDGGAPSPYLQAFPDALTPRLALVTGEAMVSCLRRDLGRYPSFAGKAPLLVSFVRTPAKLADYLLDRIGQSRRPPPARARKPRVARREGADGT